MEKMRHAAPDKHETKESPELFRASLGFDFIFTKNADGSLKCYCIEINGHDSGVGGMEDIPAGQIDKTSKIIAGIRATEHPEMRRKYRIGSEILHDLHTGEFEPSEEGKNKILQYIRKSLRTAPTFKYAYHNPNFIENLTRDKRLQEEYIPTEYRPRVWHKGENPVSSSGKWVVKPYNSRGGNGVYIAPDGVFAMSLKIKPGWNNDFVVQEYVPSSGAQMVPESIDKRAASMRLLMDFRYLEDGRIIPDFITAYQRIAPYELDARRSEIEPEDALIVNKAKGAMSAAASPDEIRMAREAAEQIIKNIALDYLKRNDPSFDVA